MFMLTTDAIDSRGFFDPRYTCDADNSSPELRWNVAPENTQSFALIVEDLDSPACHWVVYRIPAHIRHLPAGIPPQDTLPNGIVQGLNSFGKLGYAGPCPALGDAPHRYLFRLHALRENPEVPHRVRRDDLLSVIQPSLIIASAEIVGRYERTVRKAG